MARATRRRKAGAGAWMQTVLAVSAGAGAVLLGAYAVGRASKERRRQGRMDRLHAILEELTREPGASKQ